MSDSFVHYPDGVSEGHPDYLETLSFDEAWDDDGPAMCMDFAPPHGPLGARFACSRYAEHLDDHAAHGGPYPPGLMLARWPRELSADGGESAGG